MKKIDRYYQEELLLLSSTLSKLLKRRFGKGPEACSLTFHSNKIIVHIRNFITPAEDVLVNNDQLRLAHLFRTSVMETVFREFADEATNVLGVTFDSYFDDWNYEENSGMLLLENMSSLSWEETQLNPILKDKIFDTMIQICAEIHKAPSKLEIVSINPNMYMIESQGILLQVEKILFSKGHLNIIQDRSFEIKDCYLEHKDRLQRVFETKINQMYLMWDYEKDRSLLFVHL
ncbi:Na-translocating system protein MpsC family protein [Metabacillus litoralis]|uniref:Na-translocating system protein MpsC family protein n=1 Tax=Metabacillus litoralis TaxID=152268 RepID=UPI00131552B9|nr:Na-translocating system protein MpsC family protein [Metabacillus litoralis]